jgi:amino acid transporter
LIACTLSIGLFYIFVAYATAVGFNMDAQALGTSQIPFIAALGASAPALLIVAYLAGVTSFMSGVIAGTNSFARILFNSGREGLLPEIFGKIHSQHRTPYIAVWAFLLAQVALVLGFGLLAGVEPLDYFAFAGTLGTIPMILTYMLTNLALPVYVIRYQRADLDLTRHLILPIVGTPIMLLPLWGLVQPDQSWPLNSFPWIGFSD